MIPIYFYFILFVVRKNLGKIVMAPKKFESTKLKFLDSDQETADHEYSFLQDIKTA